MMTDPVYWCFEGYVDDNRQVWRTMVTKLPFRVGRRADSNLVLPFGRVSQRHAELFLKQDDLWLRDLGSTNGTFLNGKRVDTDCLLKDGDSVHFADHEFRLITASNAQPISATQTIRLEEIDLPSRNFDRVQELREMLKKDTVKAVFQPVVALADGAVMGYEVLGRGDLGGLEAPPKELFYLAEGNGFEIELSTAFRNKGVVEAQQLPEDPVIFVNTHPRELERRQELLESLRQLRGRHPTIKLILEIHESAVADIEALRALRDALADLDVGIAFDDFGTGQARLLELIDASPQFVKFDRVWIKDLHLAARRRLDMVQTLVNLVVGMGISTIAEGIECQEEADACAKAGFEFVQGYHFGRPSPVAVFF